MPRRRRSPVGPILLVILFLFVAFLVWLSMKDTEVPTGPIEQDVTNAALAK
jgi:hypothetical protein